MSAITRTMIGRTAVTLAVLAVGSGVWSAVPAAAADSADSADSAAGDNWACAYKHIGTTTYGSACWKGRQARVCDMQKDGRYIRGVFSVRYEGGHALTDTNGYGHGCVYRTFAHEVKGAYAERV